MNKVKSLKGATTDAFSGHIPAWTLSSMGKVLKFFPGIHVKLFDST